MLHIESGIIQDDHILGVPFTRAIVPATASRKVRTDIPLEGCLGLTNHNTANPGAGAANHARWLATVAQTGSAEIGVHFFVDGTGIWQTLPINEVSWHAGDGRGNGNMRTISIEICETEPIADAEANAAALNAAFLLEHPDWRIYKHQDWSGKFCPRLILARPNGWDRYCEEIRQRLAAAKQPPAPPAPLDNVPSPWAADALHWARETGLLVGDDRHDLALHRAATREEVIVLLERLAKLLGGAPHA